MTDTAASHQGLIQMLWFDFLEAAMLSTGMRHWFRQWTDCSCRADLGSELELTMVLKFGQNEKLAA